MAGTISPLRGNAPTKLASGPLKPKRPGAQTPADRASDPRAVTRSQRDLRTGVRIWATHALTFPQPNTETSLAHAPDAHEGRRVVELFAGVGGFRLGLEGAPGDPHRGERWRVVWSNQWEPSTKTQHASDCYVHRFGPDGHSSTDIARVLDAHERGDYEVPEHDLLVGGFPCQDYSVARPLSQADGIAGRKGVLWWEINRLLELRQPKYVLLENVDRLLKSPSTQRGRDFAVMLACFERLGYSVQWRVVNAADYGLPQRRRRVFILAELETQPLEGSDPVAIAAKTGVFAKALPVEPINSPVVSEWIGLDPFEVSETFGVGRRTSPWRNAGVLLGGVAHTFDVDPPEVLRNTATLGSVLQPEEEVDESFYIAEASWDQWVYLKGAKRESRLDKRTGHRYVYAEGGVEFPDPLDRPSRTVLTGEGGTSASRFKHVVETESGYFRRLTPVELERLNGFPEHWTAEVAPGRPMPDGRRAFMMGNALVVDLVSRIGVELAAARDEGRSILG